MINALGSFLSGMSCGQALNANKSAAMNAAMNTLVPKQTIKPQSNWQPPSEMLNDFIIRQTSAAGQWSTEGSCGAPMRMEPSWILPTWVDNDYTRWLRTAILMAFGKEALNRIAGAIDARNQIKAFGALGITTMHTNHPGGEAFTFSMWQDGERFAECTFSINGSLFATADSLPAKPLKPTLPSPAWMPVENGDQRNVAGAPEAAPLEWAAPAQPAVVDRARMACPDPLAEAFPPNPEAQGLAQHCEPARP